ncbi:MAG: type 2 isopentenyl-diphosphate Delta-isomerase [Candidatus Eremiobacteraeota bacterium]|nr:type 2 isopentenyl-diphosphate Delta-isomerase [Candidatus Eremiobacteraeota bacterium]
MAEQTPASETEARKSRHLDICLEDDVASGLDAGFSKVRLRHEALPECALADVDASTTLLGRALRAPIVISSMTGGTDRAREINRNLAIGAERTGVALALGSQRAALENEALLDSYDVRAVAPTVMLFANLGAVQFNYGVTVDDARRAVADIRADGLYLHLNPLQEALQLHGDTDFRGLLAKIASLCANLGKPVIAKSVGSGIAVSTAARLLEAGVAAIDVAGAGGTSWARVEGKRAGDPRREALAETFAGWGYPTVEATAALRAAFPAACIIASGGVRSGVDVAKALALGANAAGIALPLLAPATKSAEAVVEVLEDTIAGLRIAMFASGCRKIARLREALHCEPSSRSGSDAT